MCGNVLSSEKRHCLFMLTCDTSHQTFPNRLEVRYGANIQWSFFISNFPSPASLSVFQSSFQCLWHFTANLLSRPLPSPPPLHSPFFRTNASNTSHIPPLSPTLVPSPPKNRSSTSLFTRSASSRWIISSSCCESRCNIYHWEQIQLWLEEGTKPSVHR
ncbi:hypothetical protein K439DRAFT_1190645 [Ramaria rubella]|nr:hypothetical protein K439DRAFT_1190645 [Ramaria rubella]